MVEITDKNITQKKQITLDFFYQNTKNKFKLKLLNKVNDLSNIHISEPNIHRPGLALAGFVDLFSCKRIQLFGNTEIKYLSHLTEKKRYDAINKLMGFKIPCIIITNNNKAFPELISLANEHNIPIFSTEYSTTKTSYFVGDFLDDQFAPRISIHGSFVDVYGTGMLFTGKSGVGKSEVALDLVERGHRLVADDVVILTKKGEGILMGSGTNLVEHFMEVRGVGIVDVKSMFGIRAVRIQKRLEVVIELEIWDSKTEYTRTGLDNTTVNIGGVEIPYVKVPIVPGKNLTVIAEIIALNYLLKYSGYDAAQVFHKKLIDRLQSKTENSNDRKVNYFGHDFE